MARMKAYYAVLNKADGVTYSLSNPTFDMHFFDVQRFHKKEGPNSAVLVSPRVEPGVVQGQGTFLG